MHPDCLTIARDIQGQVLCHEGQRELAQKLPVSKVLRDKPVWLWRSSRKIPARGPVAVQPSADAQERGTEAVQRRKTAYVRIRRNYH
jgi:hypothetical protein